MSNPDIEVPKPFSASTTSNWVARAGGLPHPIQHVAHALVAAGHPESEAIAIAVSRAKAWARGAQHVHPDTQAVYQGAVREWEQKKAGTRKSWRDAWEHELRAWHGRWARGGGDGGDGDEAGYELMRPDAVEEQALEDARREWARRAMEVRKAGTFSLGAAGSVGWSAAGAGWRESLHPRGYHGMFTFTTGGKTPADAAAVLSTHPALAPGTRVGVVRHRGAAAHRAVARVAAHHGTSASGWHSVTLRHSNGRTEHMKLHAARGTRSVHPSAYVDHQALEPWWRGAGRGRAGVGAGGSGAMGARPVGTATSAASARGVARKDLMTAVADNGGAGSGAMTESEDLGHPGQAPVTIAQGGTGRAGTRHRKQDHLCPRCGLPLADGVCRLHGPVRKGLWDRLRHPRGYHGRFIPVAVYGTLLPGQRLARVAEAVGDYGDEARIPGRLLAPDPHSFPMLVPGDGEVVGRLLHPRGEAGYKALDRTEGYDPARPESSMYVRRLTTVQTPNGPAKAYVYHWNQDTRGLRPVPGGDWAAYARPRTSKSARNYFQFDTAPPPPAPHDSGPRTAEEPGVRRRPRGHQPPNQPAGPTACPDCGGADGFHNPTCPRAVLDPGLIPDGGGTH